MQVQEMKLTAIKPYENNPRKNDPAVDAVAASIKEFGWQQPIVVDRDLVIIAGHTRWKAAKKLKCKVVPVLVAEGLTDEQVKAYRLADNKSGELAEWDEAMLFEELAQIGDIDMTVFGFDAIDDLTENGKTDEDSVPEVDENNPPVSVSGEVYQLGSHRLMCGDSTKAEDVARLMDGERADISFTSPPYGVEASFRNVTNSSSLYDKYEDKIDTWLPLIEGSWQMMHKYSEQQFINIQMLGDNKRDLVKWCFDHRENLVDVAIWNKDRSPPQACKNVMNNKFEFIFIFGKANATRVLEFGNFHGNITNVFDVPVGSNPFADQHKAVFPVKLPETILDLNINAKSCIDLFGGTGTTMIACEKKGRKCFTMELSERYCDIIRRRWAEYTHGEGCDWAALTPAL